MRILFVLVSVLAITSPTFGFNLDSLFTVSVGGPDAVDSIRAMTSYRMSGTVTLAGTPGTFVQYFALPDRYYMSIDLGGLELVQAYDGVTAWRGDFNGQISEVAGSDRQELLENLYFESYAWLFPERDSFFTPEYRGLSDVDGVSCHEVAFVSMAGDTVTMLFDARTGWRRLMINRVDQMITHTYADDFRDYRGILFPYYSRAVVPAANFTSEFVVDSLVVNAAVDWSLFSFPDTFASDFRFPTGKDKVIIPFQYKFGHIRLPIIINGTKRVWVILDSGASSNILHLPAVADLGLEKVGTLPAMGVSGFGEVDLLKTDSIQIGELTLYEQVAGGMNLGSLSRHVGNGSEFGGLLGYDFLTRFPILIDYSDSVLIVFNPESFELPPGGVAVPFHLTMWVPTVEGEINAIKGDFVIDLGNAFGLIIHNAFNRRHNLESVFSDVSENPNLLGGVGGWVAGKNAYAASFKIGDVVINSLRVLLPDSAEGIAGSEKLAGNIGNLILQNFDLLLDYANSRVVFYDPEPGADSLVSRGGEN